MNIKTKHTVLSLQQRKQGAPLSMLTCYDFQTAQLLNETSLDLILVGDSLGNVVLGEETTIHVTLNHMEIFGRAVKKGAPQKFVIIDMPFGSYSTIERGLDSAIALMQSTQAEAVKLEGAADYQCELIKRLHTIGIPVMGHIGLQPQSVHTQGGYHKHGKDDHSKQELLRAATQLEKAGAFAVVLECVEAELAAAITKTLSIPTIGIGSGSEVDGQVLVINDLLGMGKQAPPSFCKPVANFYEEKKKSITQYLNS